ncbi:HTTM domain-containing protein [Chryseobacterium sp. MYb264]|uniref:HTTM domain-containing protein n=1 Tax=Chryseobacterium sp. MYb264 TaxID=2745153 RepID=UPI002E11A87F|nr:HTTM domain-containing protein [Chryseobacterium sp. MYb264]
MNNLIYNRKIGASILRFLMGFLIFKDFVIYFANRKYLFGNQGIVSYQTYKDIINFYKLNWLYVDFTEVNNVNIFCFLGISFGFLFMLGILQRFSVVLLSALLFLFKIRNIYILDGADNVISVILPFYLFIETQSLSSKYEFLKHKIYKRTSTISNILSVYFSYGIMIQICIVYFFSGLHKLEGKMWRDGTALYYILNSDDFSPTKFNSFFTSSIILVKLSTWFTIIFQLLFSIFILIKKTRCITIFIGILLHTGIFFLMKIDNFSFIMISCYALFFTDNQYASVYNKLKIKYAT